MSAQRWGLGEGGRESVAAQRWGLGGWGEGQRKCGFPALETGNDQQSEGTDSQL